MALHITKYSQNLISFGQNMWLNIDPYAGSNIYKMCGHSPFFDFSKEVKIKEMRLVRFE